MRITVDIPEKLTFDQIKTSLDILGWVMVKTTESKKTRNKAITAEPIILRRYDGTTREMDAVDVQNAINKLQSELRSRANSDGRSASEFKTYACRTYGVAGNTVDYVAQWCDAHNYVKDC